VSGRGFAILHLEHTFSGWHAESQIMLSPVGERIRGADFIRYASA